MKTSNFSNNQRYGLNGISISRYPDKRSGFKGPEFPPLMPSEGLLKAYKDQRIRWETYKAIYSQQLACLNPYKVAEHLEVLAEDSEPILLCYESAKTLDKNPCHRRLVANWFGRELGLVVPEWDKSRLVDAEDMAEEGMAQV